MDGSLSVRVQALSASCHPVPTVTVTVLTTVLVAAAGNPIGTCVVAAAAVLAGQLAIGWSNDVIDAHRDAEVGRTDKPVALGLISRRATWVAAGLATMSTVPLSLAMGRQAGLVQLSVVGWGWLYNRWLKSTLLSPIPFLFAFGGLPAVATLALPGHPWPPAWTMAAAGLIGVAAHFGNVLPDLDDDRLTGVSGLPHRLGRTPASVVSIGAAMAATVMATTLGAARDPRQMSILAAVALGLACAGLLGAYRHPRSEAAFYASMAIATVDVAVIVSSHALS